MEGYGPMTDALSLDSMDEGLLSLTLDRLREEEFKLDKELSKIDFEE